MTNSEILCRTYSLKDERLSGATFIVSDSKKKNPKIPPDDFSKTTPNIRSEDFDDSDEWGKTQYGNPSEAPADDWGKTVINYNVSSRNRESGEDFGKELHPDKEKPLEPDWGLTQTDFRHNEDFQRDEAEEDDLDPKTVPYFKLPEAEREKYANIPLTPTEKANEEEERKKKAGGIPTWFWVSAGLMFMFSFSALVLLGAWIFFTGDDSFKVQIQKSQPYSRTLVDNVPWGLPQPEDTIDLVGLNPGTRKIIVRKKGFEDSVHIVEGKAGETKLVTAIQKKSDAECEKIDLTNVIEREDCANKILNNLDSPPNLDDLLRALNLYYINFDSGRHAIPPARQEFLERAATYLVRVPDGVVIQIGGHTDSDGSNEDNRALSERRANSVKKFFVEKGVKDEMLSTKGFGESSPKATNDTEGGRFQNRRIEYSLVQK